MNTQPFVIERTMNAPIQLVWEAITNAEKMKEWYFDIPGFKPEVGHEFTFKGGKTVQYVHLCTVTEVVPGKKLAHTWRYDGYPGDTTVTWELTEEGDKTHIKLTHTGLESFGTENPDFARSSFETGWTSIVGSLLPNYVEKTQKQK